MASVYTCPYCRRRYTIYRDGDYLCDCGRVFFYPPLLSSEKANFITLSPACLDSSASQSVKRSMTTDFRRRQVCGSENCPLAWASLICGILGAMFFGIASLPGLIFGTAAKLMIADPYYNYKGNGLAMAGILISLFGAIAWGAWFFVRF